MFHLPQRLDMIDALSNKIIIHTRRPRTVRDVVHLCDQVDGEGGVGDGKNSGCVETQQGGEQHECSRARHVETIERVNREQTVRVYNNNKCCSERTESVVISQRITPNSVNSGWMVEGRMRCEDMCDSSVTQGSFKTRSRFKTKSR